MKLKTIVIILTIFLTSLGCLGQQIKPTKREILGVWQQQQGGGLFDSTSRYWRQLGEWTGCFIFRSNNTIDYHTPPFDCAMGIFTLKDGKWQLKGDTLTFEIRGLILNSNWYWYKVNYKIKELTYPEMKLQLIQVVKRKEIPWDSSWDNLLNN